MFDKAFKAFSELNVNQKWGQYLELVQRNYQHKGLDNPILLSASEWRKGIISSEELKSASLSFVEAVDSAHDTYVARTKEQYDQLAADSNLRTFCVLAYKSSLDDWSPTTNLFFKTQLAGFGSIEHEWLVNKLA